MPSSDSKFRALETIKGSNGWARYLVGTAEKIIWSGSITSEPQLIDGIGGSQNLSDKSFLELTNIEAVGS